VHVQDEHEHQDAELPYWAADVFVQPTREHTLGMSVLKAMAHGLPVVISASKYCGVSGEFTHGQQAIVVADPEDAQELRRAIAVATDDRRSYELGQRARQWAQNHNWQNIVKLHEKLYFSMITERK
jgi:glycosyltransferase involved in cell wall biosynthesis